MGTTNIFNENQMRFALLIAAVSAVTLVKDNAKNWPNAYRENNNDGVDVNFDQAAHTTPSMITANRKMPAAAAKGNDRGEPLYPYNTRAAGYADYENRTHKAMGGKQGTE